MRRSYSHAGVNTAEDVGIKIHGNMKSALMIFDRFANLKYKYGNRHFWCRGYFVDTVGRNKTAIQKYIQNQLSEDKIADKISMKEFIDPFTGEPTEKGDK